jgi:parvulin-like peptidyl-prolyl isomerase
MIAAEDANGDGVLDEQFTNLRREVSKQLVREELQAQEELRRNVAVAEEEIDEYILAYADESFLGDYDAMIADYEEKGVTPEELRDQARKDLGLIKLEEELRKDIEVTDDDALDYYNEHIVQYVQPDRKTVRQLITDDEATAAAAATRARAGEPFFDLVVELSVDPEKQDKKGSLGLVSPGQLAPELDAALEGMAIGDISDPIEVGSNWYVLTVESTVPGYNYTFEEKKEEIKFLYGNQQYADIYKALLARLLDETAINFHPDYDPDLVVDLEAEGGDGQAQEAAPAPVEDAGASPDAAIPVEVP